MARSEDRRLILRGRGLLIPSAGNVGILMQNGGPLRRGAARAIVAGVLLATMVAVPARAQTNVYVATTLNPGAIDRYVAGTGGTLGGDVTRLAFANVDRPYAVVPSPDGRFLFTVGADGSITTLAVAADGTLSRSSSVAARAYGSGGVGPVVSPDGRSFYMLAASLNVLQQWTISDDGVLTPKTPATVPLGQVLPGLAMSPSGRSFYAAGATGVQRYAVAADGTLSPAGAPVGPGGSFRALAVASDGRSLYGVNPFPGIIGQWDIAADESVTAKTPGSVPVSGSAPDMIGITPFARGVYALPAGNVAQFSVGAGGLLTALTPALIPTVQQRAIASSPDGRSLYVARTGAIDQYDVAGDGLLTRKAAGPVAAGAAIDVVAAPSQGPIAALSAPASAAAGHVVALDARASSAPGGVIDRYDWDFGDGTVAADGGATAFHAYSRPGTYTATVTVTDGAGCSNGLYNGRYTLCRDRGAVATSTVVVSAAAADLRLAQTVSDDSVAVGDQFTYMLRATNAGPSEVGDAVLRDALPAGLTADAVVPSQGTCSTGDELSCALGTLRAHDSALVLVFARADASLAGSSVVNHATVASGAVPDPDPTNNAADATVAVSSAGPPQPDADVVVDKTVASVSAQVGRPIAYTMRVTNRGPRTARDAVLVDSYTGGGRLIGLRTDVRGCRRVPVLTCRLGDLAPGQTAVVAIVARQAVPGETVNEAAVTSASGDPVPANNVSAAPKRVSSRRARLTLALRGDRRRLRVGATARFALSVGSTGTDAAHGTAVCARVPAGLVPVALGGAARRGGLLCWPIGRLAVGHRREVAFTARAARRSGAARPTVRARATSLDAPAASARAAVEILAPRAAAPPTVTG